MTVLTGSRSVQAQETLRAPLLPLHNTVFTQAAFCNVHFTWSHVKYCFLLSVALVVEAVGGGEQFHFHYSLSQTGQVLDRTRLPAGMPLGKSYIQEFLQPSQYGSQKPWPLEDAVGVGMKSSIKKQNNLTNIEQLERIHNMIPKLLMPPFPHSHSQANPVNIQKIFQNFPLCRFSFNFWMHIS